MARSMLSAGMLFCRAVVTAVRSRGLALMSPPPMRAATVISLMNLVNCFPRRASLSAFLCLIELHLEWPDMARVRRLTTGRRSSKSQTRRGLARAIRTSIMRRADARETVVADDARARRVARRGGLHALPRAGTPADRQ